MNNKNTSVQKILPKPLPIILESNISSDNIFSKKNPEELGDVRYAYDPLPPKLREKNPDDPLVRYAYDPLPPARKITYE